MCYLTIEYAQFDKESCYDAGHQLFVTHTLLVPIFVIWVIPSEHLPGLELCSVPKDTAVPSQVLQSLLEHYKAPSQEQKDGAASSTIIGDQPQIMLVLNLSPSA